MFSPRFDVLCALSEYRPTAKWNLFVLYNNQDIWYENLPVHGPRLAKTVCKTLLTSHSVWTLDSDHVRPSRALVTPLDDVNRASIV